MGEAHSGARCCGVQSWLLQNKTRPAARCPPFLPPFLPALPPALPPRAAQQHCCSEDIDCKHNRQAQHG